MSKKLIFKKQTVANFKSLHMAASMETDHTARTCGCAATCGC